MTLNQWAFQPIPPPQSYLKITGGYCQTEKLLIKKSISFLRELDTDTTERSVRQYCQFYQMFPKFPIRRPTIPISGKQTKDPAINDRQIVENLLYPLSWTHIQRIMRGIDPNARAWYLLEAAEQSWDVRTLGRNISTQYYEHFYRMIKT
jgi:hypothetical protein